MIVVCNFSCVERYFVFQVKIKNAYCVVKDPMITYRGTEEHLRPVWVSLARVA